MDIATGSTYLLLKCSSFPIQRLRFEIIPGDKDGLILHASGEYYTIGVPSDEQQFFVVSVTLDNPLDLPDVRMY